MESRFRNRGAPEPLMLAGNDRPDYTFNQGCGMFPSWMPVVGVYPLEALPRPPDLAGRIVMKSGATLNLLSTISDEWIVPPHSRLKQFAIIGSTAALGGISTARVGNQDPFIIPFGERLDMSNWPLEYDSDGWSCAVTEVRAFIMIWEQRGR